MADSTARGLSNQLKAVDIRRFAAWKRLANRFKGVELYAVECPEQFMDIGTDGKVVAHANLLLTARTPGLNGRTIESSFSVPAKIEGRVRPSGELNVEDVAVSM